MLTYHYVCVVQERNGKYTHMENAIMQEAYPYLYMIL